MPGDPKKAHAFINALSNADTDQLTQIIERYVGSGMMMIFKDYVTKLFPDQSDEVKDPMVHLMLMGYLVHVDEVHNLVKVKK
jgi:hypothetical protein